MNIIIATTYDKKFNEFHKILKKNGCNVIQHMNSRDDFYDILANEKYNKIKIFAVLKEKTDLLRSFDNKPSNMRDLELVTHKSILSGIVSIDNKYQNYEYCAITNGYISYENLSKDKTDVFGWDDIFVPLKIDKTYHQLVQLGVKISSRDKAIGDFIKKFIHYDKPIVLHYNAEKNVRRPVTFDVRNIKNMLNDVLNEFSMLKKYKFNNMINQVFNNGIMFRAPHTKITKLVWYVLLNAGIPFTPKPKDPIHELVYMIHDFGHFLMPDLILNGNNNKLNRTVYVIYRMISEAITIILADMIFVDGIIKSSGIYKTDAQNCMNLYENSYRFWASLR